MANHLTLALIKPHIHMGRRVGKILDRIESEGFAIVGAKLTQFMPDGVKEFYGEHKDKPFFPNLVQVMASGPVWALALAKPNAVQAWREIMGATDPAEAEPGTLRAEFGDHSNVTNNAVHGSADEWAAQREINFFFGSDIRLAEEARRLREEETTLPTRRS